VERYWKKAEANTYGAVQGVMIVWNGRRKNYTTTHRRLQTRRNGYGYTVE
jgi:hypothetical protein